MSTFRDVRQNVCNILQELQDQGIQSVRLEGDGDIAEVCRLTCLEQHISLTDVSHAPALVVDGLEVRIDFNEANKTK